MNWWEKILQAIYWPLINNWPLVAVAAWATVVAMKSLRVIRDQTDATAKAAQAALLNAQALINAERAWILVKIQNAPEPSADNLGVYILPTVTNYGKTAGRVVKFALRRHVASGPKSLPLEPKYERENETNFILPPNDPVQPMGVTIPQSEFLDAQKGQTYLFI